MAQVVLHLEHGHSKTDRLTDATDHRTLPARVISVYTVVDGVTEQDEIHLYDARRVVILD